MSIKARIDFPPSSRCYRAKWQTFKLRRDLRQKLPSFALPYFEAAMAGDTDAATEAALTAPNSLRGHLVMLAYLDASAAVLRGVLEPVWAHDHDRLVAAALTNRQLKGVFERAAFPPQAWMPDTVRVYRGTYGLDLSRARLGHSWTIDRDVACFFARHRARGARGGLLVLTAEVPKARIAFYTDERNERETVIVGGVRTARPDGPSRNGPLPQTDLRDTTPPSGWGVP